MPSDTKLIELRQFLAERLPQARLGVAPARAVPETVPTGIESIDQGLGGGLPRGAFTELVAPGEGSGSAQFIHSLLRHTASAGRFLTLVDGADSLDIDALEPEALAHLLGVRCRGATSTLGGRSRGPHHFPDPTRPSGSRPQTRHPGPSV